MENLIKYLNTSHLRKKFVSDYSLPISVYESPYFEYTLNLYKENFKLEEKLSNFVNALISFNSDEKLLQKEWYNIKDKIFNDIQFQERYKEFTNHEFNHIFLNRFPNTTAFQEENLKYTMVSIDIKTGNFSALKYFDKALVMGCESWTDLISRYTNLEYFHESKIFRQLVFEPLSSKKQASVQKILIDKICTFVIQSGIEYEKISTIGSDELILFFKKQPLKEIKRTIQDIISKNENASYYKVESFDLEKIKDTFFVKRLEDSFVLRNVPSSLYPQAFKKVKGLPIEDIDLFFYETNTKAIAKYIKPFFD